VGAGMSQHRVASVSFFFHASHVRTGVCIQYNVLLVYCLVLIIIGL
jgi:hypothetical protein